MRLAFAVGVMLGLGLLSKRSLLVFLPLMVLAILLAPTKDVRTRAASIGLALVTTLVVGIWPFVINVAEYGDPFATAVTQAVKSAIPSPLASMPFFWLDRGYVGGLFDSLWGVLAFGM